MSDNFPTFRRLQRLRRALTPVNRARTTAALLTILSLGVGIGIIVIDGIFGRYPQFREYWILLGTAAFYLPGACFGVGWWGLTTGRVWPLRVAIAGAAWQALAAIALGVLFVYYSTLLSGTLTFLAGSVLGVVINVIFILQLLRARPWVESDATAHHGFAVDQPGDAADIIEAETA